MGDGRRYDTAEIRRAARKIRNVATSVHELSSGQVKRMMGEVPEGFIGEAANELTNQLIGLKDDLNSTANGLRAIAAALEKYAEELEETDRRLAIEIRRH